MTDTFDRYESGFIKPLQYFEQLASVLKTGGDSGLYISRLGIHFSLTESPRLPLKGTFTLSFFAIFSVLH